MKDRMFASGALLTCALSLSGCFDNVSGVTGKRTSAQSNTTLNDTGFANETGPINTAAVLIGAYRDATVPNNTGILIDLQKSLLATVGATSLQAILAGIDTNPAMQARSVTIHIAGFGIKATTTLGALAGGNNGVLRNIMNIRPRLARVDLTTSQLEVPASPSVLQLKNSNSTIITYGGQIEGSYVRRMMAMITYPGANGDFRPNASVPNYGDGYPTSSPQEVPGSVVLLPVSPEIRDHFAARMSAPQDASRFSTVPPSIATISQTYTSLALAVHRQMDPATGLPVLWDSGSIYNGLPKIDAAYFININPSVTSGPEIFPFCHSGYDSQNLTTTWPTSSTTSVEIDYTHPLACNCDPGTVASPTPCQAKRADGGITMPGASIFVDTWPSIQPDPNPNPLYNKKPLEITSQKSALIARQMALTSPPPVTQILLPSPITVNNFVFSQE